MNKVILYGNIGKDAEVFTAGSKPVCKFSLATHESYKKDGEQIKQTTWHNIVVFGEYGELIAKMATKGKECLVEGKINIQKWEKDGQPMQTFQIIAQNVRVVKNEQQPAT